MSVPTPKIVQPGSRFRYIWGLLTLAALLLVGLLYLPLAPSVQQGGDETVRRLETSLAKHEARIEQLTRERDKLRVRVAALERSAQVDQEAMNRVREELRQENADRLKMEEELAFLRGLVSGGSRKEGLYVQGTKIEPGLTEQEFRYRFTVSQKLKEIEVVSGWIGLEIEGRLGEGVKVLTLADVNSDKLDRIKMRFRHFQNVEGVLTLPDGFSPQALVVSVEPKNSDLLPLKERFDWPATGQ